VAAKADLIAPDGRKLIRHGDVYFRTLIANGTPSTAVAKPEDWPEIMRICFNNHETDLGAFLRRHLDTADLSSLASMLRGVAPPPNPMLKDRAKSLLKDGENRFRLASKERGIKSNERHLFDAGSWSVALIFDPAKSNVFPDQLFLNRIASSNPNYTGWPIWMDTRSIMDERAHPKVKDGSWEVLIVSVQPGWSDHLDFFRLDPKGEFYLKRNLQDDVSDKVPTRRFLEPFIVIRRVTEAVAAGLAFANALGWKSPDARIGFAFQWNKLAGRRLESWADPYCPFVGGGTAHDDEAVTFVDVTVDMAPSALAPVVDRATRGLFALFDGYRVKTQLIGDTVRRVLERRCSRSINYPTTIATARIGLAVPPRILSGKPMNLNRPLPTT